jgi:hypothetical protein
MRYNIIGLVTIDASMGSILNPHLVYDYYCFDVTSCNDSCEACNHKLKKWDNLDMNKYKKIVLERAVIELRYLLQSLPDYLACSYVEDSAYVISENVKDILRYQIETEHEYGEERMQQLLDVYLMSGCRDSDCRNCYNASSCGIFLYLKDYHSLDCFQFD